MIPTLDDLRARFAPEELAEISDATGSADGRGRDALTWVIGWITHVDKLDRDRALPLTDHSIWTEHDLVGALFIRDFAARALSSLPSHITERIAEDLAGADERFRGFTVDDSGVLVTRIAEVPTPGRGWWWYRIPIDGPVAALLAEYR